MAIQKLDDLEVYKLAENIAMEIFKVSKEFPNEEKYSLTDQIRRRRSSRSIAVNIAEGWGERHYEQMLKRHLIDSMGSLEETKSWLRFAKKCHYISEETFRSIFKSLEEIGSKLYNLHRNWK